MFFKHKQKELTEAPLGYWEEKSYMLAIPKNEADDLLRDSIERISAIKNVEVIENHYSVEENTFYVKINYEKEEYEVGFYLGDVSIPEYYLYKNFLFTDEERKSILSSKKAITIFMKFNENEKKSYHLQLKLCLALVPDMLGVMDESAEKMLPSKWVKMTAESHVLPSPKNLFTVQVVAGDNKKNVWLHTHGLNRCGVTELEILESDEKNYQNHYNLINTYAMYILDKKEEYDRETLMSLRKAINGLKVREQEIIYSRYIVGKTQTELSRELNISQAQVSRIEKTALENIKRYVK